MLLIRGFDSIAYSLSQLTSTLDNALQVSFFGYFSNVKINPECICGTRNARTLYIEN